MAENLDLVNTAVSLLVRAALLAARFLGRVRRRSLKRSAAMDDHLTSLCTEFESWYNTWRPHMTLEGLRPDDFYYDRKPEMPKRNAKTVPGNIERRIFAETRLTAYRLKNAA
jgi:hypothetical protein